LEAQFDTIKSAGGDVLGTGSVEGAIIVRRYHSAALSILLSVVASISAHAQTDAQTDLIGKWAGPFHGIQIEIPLRPGPFGWQPGEKKEVPGPRFVESTLQIAVDIQKDGVAAGTWTAGEFKQKFVCAEVSQAVWNCVDSGGRATLEVTSATEIKVCYLDHRENAQGAGCALLRRAG